MIEGDTKTQLHRRGSQRNTFWARVFEAARADGGWMQVPRRYTQSTAAQLTSDICNWHRREGSNFRVRGVRGVRAGERWTARWEPVGDESSDDHVVWVRLLIRSTDDG